MRARRRGVTLVEGAVVAGLMALVLGIGWRLLLASERQARGVEAESDALRAAEMVRARLAEDLAAIQVPPGADLGRCGARVEDGGRTLHILRTAPVEDLRAQGPATARGTWVTWRTRPGPEDGVLELERRDAAGGSWVAGAGGVTAATYAVRKVDRRLFVDAEISFPTRRGGRDFLPVRILRHLPVPVPFPESLVPAYPADLLGGDPPAGPAAPDLLPVGEIAIGGVS